MLNKIFTIKVHVTSRDKAAGILSVRDEGRCFHTNNGAAFCSLAEFDDVLSNLPGATYLYHANKEKNDFVNWVREVLGDEKLAHQLKKTKNQDQAIKVVNRRFEELKKLVDN